MNLKIFSVLGMMVLAVAVWFFYKEDVKVKPATPATPDVSYEVEDIKAIQTNATTGEVEYTLTAQSLTKNAQGEDVMVEADMFWQPTDADPIHLTASQARHTQETGELFFDEGFILSRQPRSDENSEPQPDPADTTAQASEPNQNTKTQSTPNAKPALIIKGTSLAGNTKANTITSDEPIHVTQGENEFMAQRLHANVQTGEYEFHQVQIEFNPPQRNDKPLF